MVSYNPYVIAAVCAFFGDVGKGRIVADLVRWLLAAGKKVAVVRALGGANAGHEVILEDGSSRIRHLLPSVHQAGACMIVGPGTVVHPVWLMKEITEARQAGLHDIVVSDLATLTTPSYLLQEELEEEARGDRKIGTTKKGIGTSYAARAARSAFRLDAIRDPGFAQTFASHEWDAQRRLCKEYDGDLDVLGTKLHNLEEGYLDACRALVPFLRDVSDIHRIYREVDVVILEGNQGTGIDNLFGTYPFVTSTGTTPMAMANAAMLPRVDYTLVVTKAYATRVGNGPFPTKLSGAEAENLRAIGKEFGRSTGRARDTGWIDLPYIRYAIQVMGLRFLPPEQVGLAITKVDVLDDLPVIPVCVKYDVDGVVMDVAPTSVQQLSRVMPRCHDFTGWGVPTTSCQTFRKLTAPCKIYVEDVASLLELPLRMVTVGPKPSQAIYVGDDAWLGI